MRLLVVCKRRPQGRDLVAAPYGRFHFLPKGLADRGQRVRVLLVDHLGSAVGEDHAFGLERVTLDVRTLGPLGLRRALRHEARAFRPDWVVGCSDAWAGWFAHALARHADARLAVDAYDDFESYMPWNLPLHGLWRRAVGAADVVTVAGPDLAGLLGAHRRGLRPPDIVPMAADPGFVPMDRGQCRASLGLPAGVPLLGYFGGWEAGRGTATLLPAFARARTARPDLRLVVSGTPPADVRSAPGVLAIGRQPDAAMPQLVNSVDVAAVLTDDTRFGRGSHPAKLCEAMACRIPVVATGTGPVRWMLRGGPIQPVPVGDSEAFADAVVDALSADRSAYARVPDWADACDVLEAALASASGA